MAACIGCSANDADASGMTALAAEPFVGSSSVILVVNVRDVASAVVMTRSSAAHDSTPAATSSCVDCRSDSRSIPSIARSSSWLRADFSPRSDIDVLVEFEAGTKIGLAFFTMQDTLSRIFGRDVDLNTPGFLGKSARKRVLEEARNIYVAA